MDEERYCTNCRALIPERESVCPACGVFAGDVFDGNFPKRKRSYAWILTVVVIALAGAGFWYAVKSTEAPPAPRKRVPFVAKAPKNEREAIDAVRRYLNSTGAKNECVALIGKGSADASYFVNAVDHCAHKPLGQYVVAAKNGKVRRR
jgi:hypothetical protein